MCLGLGDTVDGCEILQLIDGKHPLAQGFTIIHSIMGKIIMVMSQHPATQTVP